jgi:predicted RecA/RadA family phage recombinase
MTQAVFVQEGSEVDYTPGANVAAGAVVVQSTLVGVAKRPIAANTLGSLSIRGLFDAAKAAVAFTAGAAVYWDEDGNPVGGEASSGAATTTRTDNTFMGFAVGAAGETATTVRVALRSVESTAAEVLGLGDLSDVGPVTYTAGKVLVADGDSYEAVAVSGNASLAANGALTVTGAAVGDTKEVTFGTSKLARSGNNIIATLPTSDPGVAGALYVDGGTVKVSAGS